MAKTPDYKSAIEAHGYGVMRVDDLRTLLAHAERYGGSMIVFDRSSPGRDSVRVSGDDEVALTREVAELLEIDVPPAAFEVGDVVEVPTVVQYTPPGEPGSAAVIGAGGEFDVVAVKADRDGPVYVLEPRGKDADTRAAARTEWTSNDVENCGPLTSVPTVTPAPGV